MEGRAEIYGVLAEFATPERLVAAIRRMRAEGFTKMDAYSPFPLEEAAEALGAGDRSVAAAALAGGIAGGAGGYFMQWFAMARDYPFRVGGRPLHSWPAFVPITFEMTVLGATLAGLAMLFLANRLPMPHHPLFNVPGFSRATDDRFFLCIHRRDPRFIEGGTAKLLASLEPVEVSEVAY
jgi:hypothetical protein